MIIIMIIIYGAQVICATTMSAGGDILKEFRFLIIMITL